MKRHEVIYGAWIWASVVALLPELGYFIFWLGLSGFVQAAVILVLAWGVLRLVRGPFALVGIAVLALLNGLPGWLTFTMLEGITKAPEKLLDAFPLFALRSGIMLLALTPIGLLHLSSAKST